MSGLMNKFKYFIGIDDYEEEYQDEVVDLDNDLEIPEATKRKKPNNVVSLHANSNMMIIVHEPLSYEEAPRIIDDLRARKAIVVNFEQLDSELKRQIFDFINGALYAIEGKIQKVTNDIFILAPNTIEIDGLKEELNNKGIFPW